MSLFAALPARSEGVGPYRINRYRIYFRPLTSEQRRSGFRHNRPPGVIADELANEFKGDFPRFFNPNLATVYSRSEAYNGRNTLRFVLSAGLFGSDHVIAQFLAPDCHADWVGVQTDHSRGFTVQTLRRKFFTGLDAYMSVVTTGGTTAAGAGTGAAISWWSGPGAVIGTGGGALIGLGTGIVLSAGGMYINRSHFLAGRRSWVFGTKADFGRAGVANYDDIPDDALVFETAAVERLSGRIFQLADFTRLLGSFDHAVHRVWVRLMRNYLAAKDFEGLPVRAWTHQEGLVSYTEPAPFSTEADCTSSNDYADLTRLHQTMLA